MKNLKKLLLSIALAIGLPVMLYASTLPFSPALFETSLSFPITSTDTSMTLVSNVLIGGATLQSGYTCFTVDQGQPNTEYVCGTVSGTTVSSLVRGIDPITGYTSQTNLKFSHRRGADIKITDYPVLTLLRNQIYGSDTIQNIISYTTHPTFTSNTQIIDKKYADDLAIAGAPNAATNVKGIGYLSVAPASASSPVFVGDNDPRVPTVSTATVTAGQVAGLSGTSGTPSSTNKYVTNDDTSTGIDQAQTTQNSSTKVGEADATGKQAKLAQSFIANKTSMVGVVLNKQADTGSFSGTVTLSLQADTAGSPSGSNLATVTLSNATWLAIPVGSFAGIFGTPYSTVDGTTYWIVITTSTNDNSNHPNIGDNTAGGYSSGSVKYNNTTDGWVAISTIDLYFQTMQTMASKVARYDSNGFIPGKYAIDVGTTDAYNVFIPGITSYIAGEQMSIKVATSNTGAATLNVNSLGAKTIVKSVNTTLANGDILAGMVITVIYDGTNFVLQNPTANALSVISSSSTSAGPSGSGTQTITHGLGRTPQTIRITGIGQSSSGSVNVPMSFGTYNSTGNNSVYFLTSAPAVSSVYAVYLSNVSGVSNGDASGIIQNVTSTSFDIVWTLSGGTTANSNFLWEAE